MTVIPKPKTPEAKVIPAAAADSGAQEQPIPNSRPFRILP